MPSKENELEQSAKAKQNQFYKRALLARSNWDKKLNTVRHSEKDFTSIKHLFFDIADECDSPITDAWATMRAYITGKPYGKYFFPEQRYLRKIFAMVYLRCYLDELCKNDSYESNVILYGKNHGEYKNNPLSSTHFNPLFNLNFDKHHTNISEVHFIHITLSHKTTGKKLCFLVDIGSAGGTAAKFIFNGTDYTDSKHEESKNTLSKIRESVNSKLTRFSDFYLRMDEFMILPFGEKTPDIKDELDKIDRTKDTIKPRDLEKGEIDFTTTIKGLGIIPVPESAEEILIRMGGVINNSPSTFLRINPHSETVPQLSAISSENYKNNCSNNIYLKDHPHCYQVVFLPAIDKTYDVQKYLHEIGSGEKFYLASVYCVDDENNAPTPSEENPTANFVRIYEDGKVVGDFAQLISKNLHTVFSRLIQSQEIALPHDSELYRRISTINQNSKASQKSYCDYTSSQQLLITLGLYSGKQLQHKIGTPPFVSSNTHKPTI